MFLNRNPIELALISLRAEVESVFQELAHLLEQESQWARLVEQ